MNRALSALSLAALLAGCHPEEPPAPRRIVCDDKITGERLFSFDESTVRERVLVILGDSYATVTLDSGRSVVLTDADIRRRYACRAVVLPGSTAHG